MIEEVQYEFERFKEEYNFGLKKDKSNNYFDTSDYEDFYPNRDISVAQNSLSKSIEKYLKDNKDDNYKVYDDWCVHVIHKNLDKKIEEKTQQIEEQRRRRREGNQKSNENIVVNKYRKKPVVIEAVKFIGFDDNGKALFENKSKWVNEGLVNKVIFTDKNKKLIIKTLEGEHLCDVGDYIIKGVHNELYPCKPEIFIKTYEKVE